MVRQVCPKAWSLLTQTSVFVGSEFLNFHARVIAAPLSGKTLAAHGADALWVSSPNLPGLPTMDGDFGRGKRYRQRRAARTYQTFLKGLMFLSQASDREVLLREAFHPLSSPSDSKIAESFAQTCPPMDRMVPGAASEDLTLLFRHALE